MAEERELDKPAAVRLLNRILEMELAGVVRYTHYSLMVYGWGRLPLVTWLRDEASSGLLHAQEAGELVTHMGEHPSLAEHHVRYVALYKDTAEIARVYLHPVFSAPKVVFTIALDESGTLRALAEPTHSAAWEASKRISVTP